jgi:hypothetical protein
MLGERSVTLARSTRSTLMTSPFHDIVGRYRLVVSDDLLAFIERAFVDPAPQHDRARVRAEALTEAAAAELEVQQDGLLISRAGPQVLYRAQLPRPSPGADLTFEKSPGHAVTLRLLPDGSLVAHQPNKPPATFRRCVK